MKFYIAIFSAWISSTSAKYFFSQKYNRNIFDLLKFTSMDIFWLFGFWQEPNWFYASIFKNYILFINIATNFSCCFYGEFHLVLLSATTWRSNLWVLRKIWLCECLQFENHFFSNHKSESLIPWHVHFSKIQNTKILKFYIKKLQNNVSTKMFCVCKIYY